MRKHICVTTTVLTIIAMFFVQGLALAQDPTISADIPQTLSVFGEGFNYGEIIGAIFTVTSNDGFDVSFSGDSPQDDYAVDGNYGCPVFTKQDLDAAGNLVSNKYDHLETNFGVKITDYISVETGNTWGGDESATGTPANLVLYRDVAGCPDAAIGRIMPSGGTAKIHLYAKGVASNDRQAGDYSVTVTCTITANPAP
ncbi:MAG: hypothetical protein BA867_12205 [Desulfobacterales bacterium S5133MH16]|nr:MAG: hypothetical protein BA867_12205 [Desulfobacterales bacterium S5133MH16]